MPDLRARAGAGGASTHLGQPLAAAILVWPDSRDELRGRRSKSHVWDDLIVFGFEGHEKITPPSAEAMMIMSLEQRVAMLEGNLRQVLQLMQMHIAQTQANQEHLHQDFQGLAKYVLTPRASIMGDGRESN